MSSLHDRSSEWSDEWSSDWSNDWSSDEASEEANEEANKRQQPKVVNTVEQVEDWSVKEYMQLHGIMKRYNLRGFKCYFHI